MTGTDQNTGTGTHAEAAPEAPTDGEEAAARIPRGSVLEVLGVATRLGLTSFGGPIAHLGYFREEYVVKRRWLDDKTYADLVALCQFLPGAASSKLGMSIGILRAGLPGGFVAWLGFTLPSAIALTVAAVVLRGVSEDSMEWLHGLMVVAVAVVAQAVWGMARNLAPDRPRATIAIAAASAVFILPTSIAQITVIAVAAFIGWRFLRDGEVSGGPRVAVPIPRWLAIAAWVLLFGLLLGLPIARSLMTSQPVALFDSFSATTSSWPATVWPRRCPVRSSRSARTWARRWGPSRTGSWAPRSPWWPSSSRPC
jgi:chromate transporter